jgi:hypothetical protein
MIDNLYPSEFNDHFLVSRKDVFDPRVHGHSIGCEEAAKLEHANRFKFPIML